MPCIWGWVNGEGGFFEEELLLFITKFDKKLDTQICGAIKLVPAVCYQRHFEAKKQSVSGKTCHRTCMCLHKCQIPSTSEKLPVPTSPSSMPSNMPDRNFVVATAAEVTVTFFFHNSTSSCFFLYIYINKEKLQYKLRYLQNKHYNTTRTIPRGASDYDYPGAFENTKLKTTAGLSSDATKYFCETRKFFT